MNILAPFATLGHRLGGVARPLSPALRLVGIAALAAMVLGAVWLVALRPRQLATQAATAKIEAAQSAATAGAARDSITIQRERDREITRIETITREGERAIKTAPGAGDQSPAVAAALRAAVCLHASHRLDPTCHSVPRDHHGDGDAGADAGGGAPRQ